MILPLILIPYSFNNLPIESVNSRKDFGILVISNLLWSEHINSICKFT